MSFDDSLPKILLLPNLSELFSFFRSSGESEAFRMKRNGASGLPGPNVRECVDEVERDRVVGCRGVASEARWRLAGVLGSRAVVGPPASGTSGRVSVSEKCSAMNLY